MARRMSPSQIRSQLRRAEQKQRQAISKYNSDVRKYNSDRKRAVDSYNREVRAQNARVRANRQRLRREISRLSSSTTTSRYVVYRESVHTLQQSFSRIETAADTGTWNAGEELLDLSEGETANSVGVLNALLAPPEEIGAREDDGALQETSITNELSVIDPDLEARWRGALFALNPRNPDAARHFCTSSRELLTAILELHAPDAAVQAASDRYERTLDGGVSRRARIRYCLERRGTYDAELEDFVENDLDNVIALFRDFNDGAHGSAGRFDLAQLGAIKTRVEDAVHFLHRIVR